MARRTQEEQQGLLGHGIHDVELEPTVDGAPTSLTLRSPSPGLLWKVRQFLDLFLARVTGRCTKHIPSLRRRILPSSYGSRSPGCRTLMRLAQSLLVSSIVLGVIFAIFFPSYSRPPLRYEMLRKRVEKEPTRQGEANTRNEQIFIAASLYDPGGKLISGDWAKSIHGLIHILGPQNVHLSVYENDIDDENKSALQEFESSLTCNKTIVQEHLDLSTLPHVVTQSGSRKLKRMQFLATVRNRALEPLQNSQTHFDKLLYINDVIFDPVDAANLLFSTNADEHGKTRYRAACAVDFENPFKFYDTFATRDAQGYDMGVIFYPWFSGAGDAGSRRDVLAQKDAVAVTSCWGGMVAFEAKWFQYSHIDDAQDVYGIRLPLQFRADNDTYWDASECCLIHADLTALSSTHNNDTGIFMNPYIRVAYSKAVLDWLWFGRRFERLYTPIQSLVNWIGARPTFNPRRLERPGDEVIDRVWVWDAQTQVALQDGTEEDLTNGMHGTFEEVHRKALPGSFCGYRSLSYLVERPGKDGKKWSHEEVPVGV